MNKHLLGLSSLLVFAGGIAAQTWSFPLDPRRTYLRTNSDAPLSPLVLDLASLGIAPGQWLRIGSTGGFRYVNGGQDGFRSLIGVFSGSATLLATSMQQRVVDAIAAGPDFTSGGTYYGNLPIDVPEDFMCSRELWDNGIDVPVPPGATHLFLGVHDSLYSDNGDPNGDYGAVVTVVPTPSLPGTGEHLTLTSAVNGTPAALPDVHAAPPGSTMVAELHHPVGFLDGEIYVFFADVIATGGQAPNPLPGLWSANLILLQLGIVPNTPGWTDTWTLQAVAGYPGTTVIVQAGALSARARNGVFETTAAHRFEWQ